MEIRIAHPDDFPKIWEIFHEIVKKGDTYVYPVDTSYEQAKKYWMGDGYFTYVATEDKEIVGTYYIKANQPGLGSHVANAGYMVHHKHQGKKIGYKMALHSFEEAKQLGFKAMQYNIVVSTNTNALYLWKKLGFNIVGTVPKAFNHKELGYVDTYVMHRFLD